MKALINSAAALTMLALSAALPAAPALAEAGDLLVRFRGIAVTPTGESGGVQPAFPGGSLTARTSVTPEFDFTYFVTDNIAAELILATSRHQIKGQGALAGVGNAADVWLLPPTLTLQYHFNPGGEFRPYLGAGLNYTVFYNEAANSNLVRAVGATSVDATNSLGWALQAGMDYDLGGNWVLNLDVKYINLDTNVKLTTGAGIQRTELNIDPLIIGLGLGYRFSL
jgi:outer membrane protein